jgi:predicted dehydrogenase
MNAAEASTLLELPDGQLVAEAIVVRHHPQWIETRKRVRAGQIGEVRAIQCFFSYFLRDPKNVRNNADIGGGGIYDIGGYPVVIARYIFGAEPTRAISLVERDPDMKIDRLTSAIVDFGEGRRLDFTISTQLAPYQRVHIMGTKGRIEVEIPFNAPLGKKTRLYIDKGTKAGAASPKLIPIRSADQYRLQSEAFSRAVRGVEELVYGVEDAVRQMRVLDAVFRSEETGHWETV